MSKIQNIAEEIAKSIQADNARFEALPPEHKRVAVALDVLDQLALNLISADHGTYFSARFNTEVSKFVELQALLPSAVECKVCARGGLFVGMVRRLDDFTPKGFTYGELEDEFGDFLEDKCELEASSLDFDAYLVQLFPMRQLRLIEQAFEHWGFEDLRRDAAEDGALEKLAELCRVYQDWRLDGCNASTRMRLVMENIVVGGGTFDPYLTPSIRAGVPYMPGFAGAEAEARKLQGVRHPRLTAG